MKKTVVAPKEVDEENEVLEEVQTGELTIHNFDINRVRMETPESKAIPGGGGFAKVAMLKYLYPGDDKPKNFNLNGPTLFAPSGLGIRVFSKPGEPDRKNCSVFVRFNHEDPEVVKFLTVLQQIRDFIIKEVVKKVDQFGLNKKWGYTNVDTSLKPIVDCEFDPETGDLLADRTISGYMDLVYMEGNENNPIDIAAAGKVYKMWKCAVYQPDGTLLPPEDWEEILTKNSFSFDPILNFRDVYWALAKKVRISITQFTITGELGEPEVINKQSGLIDKLVKEKGELVSKIKQQIAEAKTLKKRAEAAESGDHGIPEEPASPQVTKPVVKTGRTGIASSPPTSEPTPKSQTEKIAELVNRGSDDSSDEENAE